MKFSTKGEYGLRATVNLARSYPRRKSNKEIATEEKISLKYLERLMNELSRKNILRSFKGKSGGHVLVRDPREITVEEVVETLEGPIISKCADTHCQKRRKCSSSFVWIKLGQEIKKTLRKIKLADLI